MSVGFVNCALFTIAVSFCRSLAKDRDTVMTVGSVGIAQRVVSLRFQRSFSEIACGSVFLKKNDCCYALSVDSMVTSIGFVLTASAFFTKIFSLGFIYNRFVKSGAVFFSLIMCYAEFELQYETVCNPYGRKNLF